MQRIEFRGLPAQAWTYVRIMTSRKPMLAPDGAVVPSLLLLSREVRISPRHLSRYRQVCGIADDGQLPPAYLHVLAMPLHMRLFAHADFPVKVLGLVHLRNVIRQFKPVAVGQSLQLSVQYDSLRETPLGQEYDLVTRAHVAGELCWEEVSTMLARRAMPAGKRQRIDKFERLPDTTLAEAAIAVPADTGRRYAWVSGDLNPIHLFDRTAQLFQFKQAVAHGMWSLARCLGQAALASAEVEFAAQFKLPIYLPSEVIFRQQTLRPDPASSSQAGSELTLSTPKGDRLHLLVKVSPL